MATTEANNIRRMNYVEEDPERNEVENFGQFKSEKKLFNSGPGAGKTLASHVVSSYKIFNFFY